MLDVREAPTVEVTGAKEHAGRRTDRACAISTPPIDEREVIPPDPLRRLNVMTRRPGWAFGRRALRLAHEGLHRPCSPAPGDYDPELPSGQLWRMQPEDEVFNSTEPRWRTGGWQEFWCSDLPEDPKTPGPAFYHPMPLRSPTPPAHDFSSSTVQRFTDPPRDEVESEETDLDFVLEGWRPQARYLNHGNVLKCAPALWIGPPAVSNKLLLPIRKQPDQAQVEREEIDRLLQAVSETLPPNGRICILGGTEMHNPETKPLVQAVAERLARQLPSDAVVLTGGMAGIQDPLRTAVRLGADGEIIEPSWISKGGDSWRG
eukprot:g25959.t1